VQGICVVIKTHCKILNTHHSNCSVSVVYT